MKAKSKFVPPETKKSFTSVRCTHFRMPTSSSIYNIGTVANFREYSENKTNSLEHKNSKEDYLKETTSTKRNRTSNDDDDDDDSASKSKKFKTTGNSNVDLNMYRSDTIKFGNGSEMMTYFKQSVECNDVKINFHFSGTSVSKGGQKTSDIKEKLYKCLRMSGKNKPVVGCVAWLSDKKTLELLRQTSGVAIIVNREDYTIWGNGCVRNEYPKLPKMIKPMYQMFDHLGGTLCNVERHRVSGSSSLFPIRAFGNSSNAKKPVGRRFGNNFEGFGGLEHCKYLVFFETGHIISEYYRKKGISLKVILSDYDYCYKHWSDDQLYPFYVWTGSMNLTGNAKNNHDNAIFGMDLIMGLSFYYDFSVTYINSTPVFSKTKGSTPTITTTK